MSLELLPQYPIERDEFVDMVEKTIGYERLVDAFCWGNYNDTYNFTWFRNGDEFYIIHRDSGMMVNWYKHVGRCLTCSQPERPIEDYIEFLTLFNEEFTEWLDGRY